jgi:nitroimidazol reductase NimA-like FMN-containing flavoprotein (pyridoxamine 5'-phosphate oxidase superfamily)
MSPTTRTSLGRLSERRVGDRDELHQFLGDALVAHLGVVVNGNPVVLPTAYAIDPAGPDLDGTLYVHGSVAARWMRAATDRTVCVTVTELDGLVAGRSPFHHSMNYRSAVVIGSARLVDEPQERSRALDLIIDHMIPGRSATLRPSTRKELVATLVLAVPLHEASMKVRAGGPDDEPTDVAAKIWGGHIPVSRVIHSPVPDAEADGPIPEDIARRTA